MYSEILSARQDIGHAQRRIAQKRTPLLKVLDRNPHFELYPLSDHSNVHVAVNIFRPIIEVAPYELDNPDLLLHYYNEHLRGLRGFRAVITDTPTYEQLLQNIERRHPGFLRDTFLYDPKGVSGLGGFRWIATATERITLNDPHERKIHYVSALASHNGSDFSRGYRTLSAGSADIGVIPVIIAD